MLPGRWRRRDGAPAKRVGLTVYRHSDSTRRSAGYALCGPSAWRQNRYGTNGATAPAGDFIAAGRALQQSEAFGEYRQRRVVVEHWLARLVQLGIRQSRYFGRAKTKFQLYLAATVANLTLVASKAGLPANTGGGSSVGSTLRAGTIRSVPCAARSNLDPGLAYGGFTTEIHLPEQGFPARFLVLQRRFI